MLTHFLEAGFYIFLVAGILCASYAGYYLVAARAFQTIEMHRFEHSAPLAEPHMPNAGEVVGQIQVTRLNLKAMIVEGDSGEVLGKAVGHIPGTAMPGEWGNVALAAHRDRLFRPLREIRQGDVITIQTAGGSFDYEVESTFVVAPTETEVLHATSRKMLTLITCFPFNYVGSAPNRFIVRAREVARKTK
jgi:sortase A